MSAATDRDRNAIRTILKTHGAKALLELVRDTLEEQADPMDFGGAGMFNYAVASVMDEALDSVDDLTA